MFIENRTEVSESYTDCLAISTYYFNWELRYIHIHISLNSDYFQRTIPVTSVKRRDKWMLLDAAK